MLFVSLALIFLLAKCSKSDCAGGPDDFCDPVSPLPDHRWGTIKGSTDRSRDSINEKMAGLGRITSGDKNPDVDQPLAMAAGMEKIKENGVLDVPKLDLDGKKEKPENESPPSKVARINNNRTSASYSPGSSHDGSPTSGAVILGINTDKPSASSGSVIGEEVVQTPPPSPTQKDQVAKPSLFSLAQVTSKLGDLWTSAREQIFGEDYWIPSDPHEVVAFPSELLLAHKIIFPQDEDSMLRIVKGSLKNDPSTPIFHVVFQKEKHKFAYSLFRCKGESSQDDAFDLCRRCLECQMLFSIIDDKDPRATMREVINKLRENPLWRMIHVAIACNREDIFTEENIDFLNKNGVPFEKQMLQVLQNDGKYPLLMAVSMNRLGIVKRMLQLGADPTVRDVNLNNVLHIAALTGAPMLELLWEFDPVHGLLNNINQDGCTPVTLAIRNVNPRCVTSLRRFGADFTIAAAGRNALFEAMMNKGKDSVIIRTILESSPSLLNEVDSSGNTALHIAMYKTPLMSLLLLKSAELDLNKKNNAGQTPLHLYTYRGDIGLMITLASYCCDINAQDATGNTPLHIAVSKKNLEATRLLLCLGADPNIRNNHDDSPRHLAARLRQADVLKALILCGAERCGAKKTGCVSGCVIEKMAPLLRSNTDDFASPRPGQLTDQPNPLNYAAPLEEHRIKDHMQKIFYDKLCTHLQNLIDRGERPRNMVNLLSLDGGGIRGLVIIQTLMALEEVMGESVYPYFDWVAGTSTGALVATALAQGKSLRDCQHIYLRFKDLVFDGWTRPYNSALLEQFMKEQIGEGNMADLKDPRIMISTVKADFFPVKVEFMRNYRLPISDKENLELGFEEPSALDIPTWKALRRTSAAPMFFSPVDDKYIDGGIISNNPALDLLAEVQLYNGTNVYLNRPHDKVEIGCMLSLGTGQIPLSPLDPLHVEITNPLSSTFALKNLGLILVDQVTATEGAPVDRSRSWCSSIGVPFFRLSAPLHKDISLGCKDDHDIAHMMWDCVEYTYQQRPYLERMCKMLKLLGRRDARGVQFNNGRTHNIQTQTSNPSTPSGSI
ncbi:unnamed protein product, partial [Mesorhabditis belari]|uniref:phospholipase A2 n=1 Tax=Mesorhabditis belari TaxID=2138241 RepID=A0AAF3ENM4_9BILA